MQSSIAEQPPLRAATVRHIGPYQEIGKAFAQLEAAAGEAGLMEEKEPLLVGIYHDNPDTTAAAKLRSDAGLVIGPGAPVKAPLAESLLAAGRYLKGRHTGSYEGLPAAWASLIEEGMGKGGLNRREGPSYELYLNNPMNATTAELITEIYIPID